MMKEADEVEIARVERMIDELHDKLSAGMLAEVLSGAREVVDRCTGLPPDPAAALTIEATLLIGEAHTELFQDDEALEAYTKVQEIEPDAPEALYGEGRLRFLRWEFERAADLFARCEGATPDIAGPALYHQAVLAQFAGHDEVAKEFFTQAAELDPDGCPPPIPSSEDDVLELLDDIVKELPSDVAKALNGVVFDVVDLPKLTVVGKETPPTTLGLYSGTPVTEAHNGMQFMPTTISVFRRNVERIAHDQEHLMAELRITILHEIGHHLGWDEDDVAKRGLA